MKFTDFDPKTQQEIVDMLNNHLATILDILKDDGCLEPMLAIPDTKTLVGLQPADGACDIDVAHAHAVEILKKQQFSYGLFSYSTKIMVANGKTVDAVKTCIFTAKGEEVSFFSPFKVSGLFKKTVRIEKTILAGIAENVF